MHNLAKLNLSVTILAGVKLFLYSAFGYVTSEHRIGISPGISCSEKEKLKPGTSQW